MIDHPDLKRLWALQKRLEAELGQESTSLFYNVGLSLEKEPYWYEVTPKNATPFAHTGGDGDHFSLMHIRGFIVPESPVIMTIPTDFFNDNPNIIVGENFKDFLALGCDVGYFGLFGFVERFEEFCQEVESRQAPSEYWDEIHRHCLHAIVTEFQLQPWTNVREKFIELQLKYKHRLVVEF